MPDIHTKYQNAYDLFLFKMVLMAFRRVSVQFRVPAHALLIPLAFSDILIGAWSILNIIDIGEDNQPMNRVSKVIVQCKPFTYIIYGWGPHWLGGYFATTDVKMRYNSTQKK